MALCAGQWDDTLINLPWLAFALALGLGFYEQVRAAGAGPLFAMAASYALLSLPFLGVHVALPGYADLPLAVFIGLASFAFWRWSMERRSGQLVLALLLAASSPMIKTPGWIWLGLLVPALLPVVWGVRGWKALLGLGAVGATALFLMAHYHPRLLGYELHTNFHPVGQALLETTLVFSNWHLLWLGAPLLVLVSWRDLAKPPVAALTAYLGGGLAFLLVVFFFSNAALWVADFSTVNRALLHLAPTLVFYCALLALGLRERLRAAPATVAPTTAEAPLLPNDRSSRPDPDLR
jgi:glucan phosphoethanolaminetransferase (alkaline phosphatase superfamily)